MTDQLELNLFTDPRVIRLDEHRHRRPRRPVPVHGAILKPFPLDRCSSVQVVELALRDLRGQRRTRFWRETIAELRAHLTRLGLPPHRVERQLWAFHDAVERRLNGEDDRQGGGAA